jgi:trehalose synthase
MPEALTGHPTRAVRIDYTGDLWWKNAVFYCLDVETFMDADGDGCGDFEGLIEQLDYLAGLGVTCLWLMPFYPTPNRDDGYDVSDHLGVDPRFGTLGEFTEFVRTASDRGLRVIVDLVVNHTSDQHPWFQAARSDPRSPYRDYYVWRKRKPPEPPGSVAFPGEETSIWQHDRRARAYYLHRFYRFQPDVNIASASVRDEIAKIMGFWLQQDISGFRVDAVPAFAQVENRADEPDLDPQDFLRELRAFMSRRSAHAMWMGEANVDPEDTGRYLGGGQGDQLNMLFNFILMQALYLSLARGRAEPIEEALRRLPEIPEDTQWANFLRVHDELTLDKLTAPQREEVFAAFGPQKRMQAYGRGLRRRLAPMVDGDQRKLRMLFSLTFSLPGTPMVFYGDEIGMGENLALPGRLSVRTPMQWSDQPNGGFSAAPASRLVRALPSGEYGPQRVNVAAQNRDPDSQLAWMRQLIRLRRETPELGWGKWKLIETRAPTLVVHRCDWQDSTVIAAHNVGSRRAEATLPPHELGECEAIDDLFEGGTVEPRADGSLRIALDGYGYRWLRVRRAGQRPRF